MTWNDLLEKGRVERHTPQRAEIAALRKAARRALADAALEKLSPESKYQLAYDAVLAQATLAVLASGYRVRSRVGHHQITIEAAGITLGDHARDLVQYLEHCRRTRNDISYEGTEVGAEQANELIAQAKRFADIVSTWLKDNHPSLT